MAFNVAALVDYTNEPDKVIYKMLAQGNMFQNMTIQSGIKSAETINIFTTEGVWQSGTSCGFTASGETVATQRTITVGKIKINLSWCMKALEAKFTQKGLPVGSKYTELAFKDAIIGDIQQAINKRVNVALWKGDTTSGDAYLNKFDGLSKIINAASNEIVVTPGAWSVANSRTRVQEAYAAVTDDMLTNPNTKMFMGTAEARDYRLKIGIDNLYHMTGTDAKLYAENTDIEIVPVLGLSGTKQIYVAAKENLYAGVDLFHEDEKFELFYAKEADEVRFVCEFKLGTQVAFPDQIVKMLNT